MRIAKLATTVTGVLLTLGAGIGTAAATGTHADTVSPAVSRVSVPCTLPQGASANYSWAGGIETTTIYYNNHCQSSIFVSVHITGRGVDCWNTPKGKGKEVFPQGVNKITEGC